VADPETTVRKSKRIRKELNDLSSAEAKGTVKVYVLPKKPATRKSMKAQGVGGEEREECSVM
jgi:hypothetical protein